MVAQYSNRQSEILKMAIDIIDSNGIQGFTIKNLSHSLGLTEAAIYRHFKSKLEILTAILDIFIDNLLSFSQTIISLKLSSIEKIKRIYKQLSEMFMKNPAYVSVIFAEEIFKNDELLSAKVEKILDINNETFISIIEQGQKNNEITKAVKSQELSLIIVGAYRLMVKRWKINNFSYDLLESSDRLMNTVKTLIINK